MTEMNGSEGKRQELMFVPQAEDISLERRSPVEARDVLLTKFLEYLDASIPEKGPVLRGDMRGLHIFFSTQYRDLVEKEEALTEERGPCGSGVVRGALIGGSIWVGIAYILWRLFQ